MERDCFAFLIFFFLIKLQLCTVCCIRIFLVGYCTEGVGGIFFS